MRLSKCWGTGVHVRKLWAVLRSLDNLRNKGESRVMPHPRLVLKAHSGWSVAGEWEASYEVVAAIQVRKEGGPGDEEM